MQEKKEFITHWLLGHTILDYTQLTAESYSRRVRLSSQQGEADNGWIFIFVWAATLKFLVRVVERAARWEICSVK